MASTTREEGPDGNLNAGMGDDFMVAADLTLYGNPLRCLTTRKKKPEEKPAEPTGTPEKKTETKTPVQVIKKLEESKLDKKLSNHEIASNVLRKTPANVESSIETIAADMTKYNSPLDEKI